MGHKDKSMSDSAIAGKFREYVEKHEKEGLRNLMTWLRNSPLSIKPMAIYPHLPVAAANRNSEGFQNQKEKEKE